MCPLDISSEVPSLWDGLLGVKNNYQWGKLLCALLSCQAGPLVTQFCPAQQESQVGPVYLLKNRRLHPSLRRSPVISGEGLQLSSPWGAGTGAVGGGAAGRPAQHCLASLWLWPFIPRGLKSQLLSCGLCQTCFIWLNPNVPTCPVRISGGDEYVYVCGHVVRSWMCELENARGRE